MPGCLLLETNRVAGKYTNAISRATGTLIGTQKANTGIFSGAGGLYSGSLVGPYPGTVKILLCPDGSYAYYKSSSATPPTEGWVSSLAATGIVDFYPLGGLYPHVQGDFTRASRSFTLLIHEFDSQISTATLTLINPLF
jgi:hypothetical protein